MAILNRQALYRVFQNRASPCLSAFFTLGQADEQSNPATRLRAALHAPSTHARWQSIGTRSERESLLAPVLGLVNREDFWEEVQGGLAVYWGPGVFRYYVLPWHFTDAVFVGDRFQVRPLIPLLAGDGHYWILVLGQHRIRLLQASPQLAREVDYRDLPVALTDLMSYDVGRRTWIFRSPTGRFLTLAELLASVRLPALNNQLSDRRLAHLLRDMDRSILRLIGTRRRPMVLVGEAEILASYRSQSSYPILLSVESSASDDQTADALQRLTYPVVAPVLSGERESCWKQVSRALSDIAEAGRFARIRAAAQQRRVRALFVDLNARGHRTQGGGATLAAEVDYVVLETYLHGGSVFVARPGELPAGVRVAANIHEQPTEARANHQQSTAAVPMEHS